MKSRIFIGSSSEGLDMAYAIQENLERVSDVTVWNQNIFKPSRYVLEDLEEALESFDYGIFVFSPDDVYIREEKYKTARDNVTFELGLFIGKLGREDCFFITPSDKENYRIATDLLGISTLSYDSERMDGNLFATFAPVCNKIKRQIKSFDDQYAIQARAKYDILSNKYPNKRTLRYLDTACIFDNRNAFNSFVGYKELFNRAKNIKGIGISLNSITIDWGLADLRNILNENECIVELLFLDPDGESIKRREIEENLEENTIINITKTTTALARKIKKEYKTEFNYRLYDSPPSLNMYIIDDRYIVLQHYIQETRGQEAPVFIIINENREIGLFKTYKSVFQSVWEKSHEDH